MIVRASTENPYGFRPWQSRLGSLPAPARARRRGLGFLGQVTGDRCVYVADFYQTLSALFSSTTLLGSVSTVAGILSQNPGISVQSSSVSGSWTGLGSQSITLNLLITGSGYGQWADVQAMVDNAFYQALGALPSASRITSTQTAGAAPIATGAPPAPTGGSPLDTGQLPSWAMYAALALVGVVVVRGLF